MYDSKFLSSKRYVVISSYRQENCFHQCSKCWTTGVRHVSAEPRSLSLILSDVHLDVLDRYLVVCVRISSIRLRSLTTRSTKSPIIDIDPYGSNLFIRERRVGFKSVWSADEYSQSLCSKGSHSSETRWSKSLSQGFQTHSWRLWSRHVVEGCRSRICQNDRCTSCGKELWTVKSKTVFVWFYYIKYFCSSYDDLQTKTITNKMESSPSETILRTEDVICHTWRIVIV